MTQSSEIPASAIKAAAEAIFDLHYSALARGDGSLNHRRATLFVNDARAALTAAAQAVPSAHNTSTGDALASAVDEIVHKFSVPAYPAWHNLLSALTAYRSAPPPPYTETQVRELVRAARAWLEPYEGFTGYEISHRADPATCNRLDHTRAALRPFTAIAEQNTNERKVL